VRRAKDAPNRKSVANQFIVVKLQQDLEFAAMGGLGLDFWSADKKS
jgi:hypothetical protein